MREDGCTGPPFASTRQSQQQSTSTPPTVFNIFAVRYKAGVSRAAAFASLQRSFGRTVLKQLPAEDVVNLQSVDGLPLLLAGLIALLGVMTLANTLVISVRRRRRDLAILKTIGFLRSQVAAVVAWQATSFALLALLLGLPLGIAGGRWAWSAVASGIGSASPAIVPSRRGPDCPRDLGRRQRDLGLARVEGGSDPSGDGDPKRVVRAGLPARSGQWLPDATPARGPGPSSWYTFQPWQASYSM